MTTQPPSLSAQAVLDAANAAYDKAATVAEGTAAALRALAACGEAVEIRTGEGMAEFDGVVRTSKLLAIAAELSPTETTND